MALIDKLTAIADAIRGKTGKTEEMTLDQMATEIAVIEVGGENDVLLSIIDRSITEFSSSEITKIGKSVFRGAEVLEKINAPNVKKIGGYAFEGCIALTGISFPLVTEVNESGFQGCTSLVDVNLPAFTGENDGIAFRNPNYMFRGCTLLKKVILPEAYRMGTYGMFRDCAKLEEVRTPKMTNTGQYHLYNCKLVRLFDAGKTGSLTAYAWGNGTESLETLILRSETVVSFSQQTGSTLHTSYTGEVVCNVYIPEALIEEYKVATNWSAIYEAGRCNFVALEGSVYE